MRRESQGCEHLERTVSIWKGLQTDSHMGRSVGGETEKLCVAHSPAVSTSHLETRIIVVPLLGTTEAEAGGLTLRQIGAGEHLGQPWL